MGLLSRINGKKFDEYGINLKTGTKFDEFGYDVNGFNIVGYDREGYDKNGFSKPDLRGKSKNKYTGTYYDNEGYDRDGYDSYGYNKNGINKNGFYKNGIHHKTGTKYNDEGYNEEGYDKNGFNKNGVHRNHTKYDDDGYNKDGYDINGYNKYGIDSEGFYKNGIHSKTGTYYDEKGYNNLGKDKDGYYKSGYNDLGINKNGYNIFGHLKKRLEYAKYSIYDEYGYDYMGYDRNGFNRNKEHRIRMHHILGVWEGLFDEEGYDVDGFNINEKNRNGYDKYYGTRPGFNENKINIETGTEYDKNGFDYLGYNKDRYDTEGYDPLGFNKDGFNRYGYDEYGFNKEGYDYYGYGTDGYNKNGFNINGYNREGYNSFGYDKDGYDKNGFNKDGYNRLGQHKSRFIKKSNSGNNKGIKICSIASGSNGNCYYIGDKNEGILIDLGISYTILKNRLNQIDVKLENIKGVFISHEHSDHIIGLQTFHKYNPNIPIYFNKDALKNLDIKYRDKYEESVINLNLRKIELGEFIIHPFKKEHDTRYPISFRVELKGKNIGIFTDIGIVDEELKNNFSKCDAVFLETNYDEHMLKNGPYSSELKNRVKENHLSNNESYNLIKDYANPNLKYIILSHISANNNSIDKINSTFKSLESDFIISIAGRDSIGEVFEL